MKTAKDANISTLKYTINEIDEAMKRIGEVIESRIVKNKFFARVDGIIILRNYQEVITKLTELGYVCVPYISPKDNYCKYIRIYWDKV